MPIRVVVAEDNYLVREAVTRLLEVDPDIEVAGVCEDFDGLIAMVETEQPDVVLTDIRMPPTGTDEGVRAAAQLRQSHPAARRGGAQPVRRAGRTRSSSSTAAPSGAPTS